VIDAEQVKRLIQSEGNVRTFEGDKIGTFGQFYIDDDSGRPNWVTVRTGFFGTSESFVPLGEAAADGSDLLVPYSKDLVKDAPRIDHDGHLSPEEEDRLYRHYQLRADSPSTEGVASSAQTGVPAAAEPTTTAGGEDAEAGPWAAGTAAEDVRVRHMRLRRYTVIEDVPPAGTDKPESGAR
jgi:PRC-barrel domain